MRTLVKAAAFAAVSLWGAAASAQDVQMKFVNGGSVTDGHYYVGNYNATENGAPVTINCVDYFHAVVDGQAWQADATNLGTGDLTATRGGVANLSNYQKQAYLSTFITGSNNTQIAAIQHAIWSFYYDPASAGGFESYVMTDLANSSGPNDAGYWVNQANSNYNHMSDGYYNRFQIITDDETPGTQEFVTTTPEPSSVALLGTGLFGLVPMVRRRRRK